MSMTQAASGVDGEIIWWDDTSTDVAHAARLVFGRLVRLAIPVIARYESDLFHDARWLVDHLAGASFTFFWSVGESGTAIGTDERAVTQAAATLHHTGLYRGDGAAGRAQPHHPDDHTLTLVADNTHDVAPAPRADRKRAGDHGWPDRRVDGAHPSAQLHIHLAEALRAGCVERDRCSGALVHQLSARAVRAPNPGTATRHVAREEESGMPSSTRKNITPGDRVTVQIQYSNRSVLRPLIGVLRTVQVINGRRAVIFNEDGTRYAVNGRTVPPVALVEVSIFTDRTTGGLWAQVYDLPPRERGPYPIHPRYAPVAVPDGQGGIARIPSCWCGNGCVCPTCGEQTIRIPANRGLDWSVQSLTGATHSYRCAVSSSCPSTGPSGPSTSPRCCAMPMMLAPRAWVCVRESLHQRPYLWPDHPTDTT